MTTNIIENKSLPETSAEDIFVFPTSFAQKRIWFLEQIGPGNSAYNNYVAIRLKGELNVLALEQSLNAIARRHESLRTKFAVAKGETVQVVLPSVTLKLPVTELRSLPPEERELKAKQLIEREIERPFDLGQLPLIRFSLLQLGDSEHILISVVHHIISDGWFAQVMMGELGALYTAFCAGKPSPLPQLSIQYADYTIHQEKYLQGKVLEKLLDY